VFTLLIKNDLTFTAAIFIIIKKNI
jgi:hypothetical protein